MSINKVILVGNCCKDAETRYMANGEAVTNISIATNEKWKDKDGNKQEKAEFHNLVFYRRLAEVAGEYLKKGSQIYVEGKITTDKWQDKEGKDRFTTKIVVNEMQMLGGKSSGGGSFEVVDKPAASAPSGAAGASKPAPAKGGNNWDDIDSDIPF